MMVAGGIFGSTRAPEREYRPESELLYSPDLWRQQGRYRWGASELRRIQKLAGRKPSQIIRNAAVSK
jgi:hypothetical protein